MHLLCNCCQNAAFLTAIKNLVYSPEDRCCQFTGILAALQRHLPSFFPILCLQQDESPSLTAYFYCDKISTQTSAQLSLNIFIRGVQESMVRLKQGFDHKSMTGYTSDFSVGWTRHTWEATDRIDRKSLFCRWPFCFLSCGFWQKKGWSHNLQKIHGIGGNNFGRFFPNGYIEGQISTELFFNRIHIHQIHSLYRVTPS